MPATERITAGTVAAECVVHEPAKPTTRTEARTQIVVGLTAVTMVVELIVGTLTHSLALTADGWHMATHVGALGLTALAYWYARTRAREVRFAFGTGKIYALAGFTSSGLLVAVSISMLIEGVERFIHPEAVDFADAFPVAVLGLFINLLSAVLLNVKEHGHHHAHDHSGHAHHDHDHAKHDHEGHDHNLRAAYLHVVADALTSLLAIGALAAGRYLNWGWLDPAVAVVASLVIMKWGFGLLRDSALQLIDVSPSLELRDKVRSALEGFAETRVVDLHLWRVSPTQLACVVTIDAQVPGPLDAYKQAVRAAVPVDHLTVEICPRGTAARVA
ncbi:MAG: CDF family Co(II)/Ni(II) efflux transporter DmeF [Archangium sp.]|nr:CDF family Co(II)/Ni(II) efflux transporter DmeF [Archangium sp.]